MTDSRAMYGNVSLYPDQWAVIEEVANALGLQGKKRRSPALQFILRDWHRRRESDRLRGVDALIATPSPAVVDLSEGALEPFPASAAPTYWWHVDGVLVAQDGDTTDGTRVASGTTAQEAADKVITACTTARGGTWQWATPPVVVKHANQRDPNCPICKRVFAPLTPAHSYNPEDNHEN